MAATQSGTGSVSQITDQLNNSMASAGTAIDNGMSGMITLRKARLTQQLRYAAALEKQYGANDAGTKAAKAKVNASKLIIARASAAHQENQTPAVTVSSGQWALQGNVYDPNAQPIPRLTVFLVDAEKAWQRQYGFAYTDANGYFMLASDSSAAGKEAASYTQGKTPPMFIEIANEKALPIYLDKMAFTPVLGQATYKKIVLSSQTPIGDPPQPLREVGIPPAG
jgi:hypothetical protein